jgi:hypothetical protein
MDYPPCYSSVLLQYLAHLASGPGLFCYNHPPLELDVPVEYQTNLNTTRISSLGHVSYV